MRRAATVATLALLTAGLLAAPVWAAEESAGAPDADPATVWIVLAVAALLMAGWVLIPIFRRIPKTEHHDEEH